MNNKKRGFIVVLIILLIAACSCTKETIEPQYNYRYVTIVTQQDEDGIVERFRKDTLLYESQTESCRQYIYKYWKADTDALVEVTYSIIE